MVDYRLIIHSQIGNNKNLYFFTILQFVASNSSIALKRFKRELKKRYNIDSKNPEFRIFTDKELKKAIEVTAIKIDGKWR